MINYLKYIIFFAISLLFFGCPYQSNVQLCTYEEALKVDKNLLGIWVTLHSDGSKDELMIEKIAKSVLQVSHKAYDKNERAKGMDKYRLYATTINGTTLFNIENKEGKYMFARYGWTGKNTFNVELINQDFMIKNFVVDSVSTDQLNSFLFEFCDRKEIYDDKIEFYRKDSPEYLKVKTYIRKSGF